MATTEPISASKTETPWPSSRRRTSRRSWGCYRLRRRKTHVRLGHHRLSHRHSWLGRGSDAERRAAHLAELAAAASLAPARRAAARRAVAGGGGVSVARS